MTNLIIIGNGYDLTCGLKSSYTEFFNYKYNSIKLEEYSYFYSMIKEQDNKILSEHTKLMKIKRKDTSSESEYYEVSKVIKNTENTIKEMKEDRLSLLNSLILNSSFTLWDYIFLNEVGYKESKDVLWSDIESRIKKILNIVSTGTQLNKLPSIFKYYINSKKFNNDNISFLKIDDFLKKFNYDNIYEFLLFELNEFEKSFRDYLSLEVKSNGQYKDKSKKLYYNIIGETEEYQTMPNYILSFNYTNPFINGKGYGTFDNKRIYVNSVHGYLESGEVIFGIDDFDNVTEEMDIFTKTNRKMNIEESSIHSIPKKESVKEIFFFGHSFSEADYSYFLSIFDYYEIYNSNVRLNFDYINHCDSAKKNHLRSINKLMNKYGESFDNKAKGKNLMHKLNLEGRIHVREIGAPKLQV